MNFSLNALTVSTSVKLRSDVTDSPVFTHFKEIVVPSAPVINTFTLPLCITYTFSSGSPRKRNFHDNTVTWKNKHTHITPTGHTVCHIYLLSQYGTKN
jgi:hypothetical protein